VSTQQLPNINIGKNWSVLANAPYRVSRDRRDAYMAFIGTGGRDAGKKLNGLAGRVTEQVQKTRQD